MKLKALIFAVLTGCLVAACGIYSFSGTSIQPDVKSITIPYVEYKALRVNPALSGQLTEALQEKFRKLTSLEQVETDGDLAWSRWKRTETWNWSARLPVTT